MADDDDGQNPGPVGYRKPPVKSRFKKGQSGNPKGRRKGSLNLSTLIQRQLNSKVVITERGVRKSITKRELIAMQIVNKAAAGDPKAIPILLGEERALQPTGVGSNLDIPIPISEEDQRTIESLIQRIRQTERLSSPTSEEENGHKNSADQTKGPGKKGHDNPDKR